MTLRMASTGLIVALGILGVISGPTLASEAATPGARVDEASLVVAQAPDATGAREMLSPGASEPAYVGVTPLPRPASLDPAPRSPQANAARTNAAPSQIARRARPAASRRAAQRRGAPTAYRVAAAEVAPAPRRCAAMCGRFILIGVGF